MSSSHSVFICLKPNRGGHNFSLFPSVDVAMVTTCLLHMRGVLYGLCVNDRKKSLLHISETASYIFFYTHTHIIGLPEEFRLSQKSKTPSNGRERVFLHYIFTDSWPNPILT